MPKRDKPLEVHEKYLESAQVQLNFRIPLRLRMRVDKYTEFMRLPISRRPPHTEEWPSTMTGLVTVAIEEFLANHPLVFRTGPNKPRAVVKPKAVKKRKET